MIITTPQFDLALASLRDRLTKSEDTNLRAYHEYLIGLTNLCIDYDMAPTECLEIIASEMVDAWSLIDLLQEKYEEAELRIKALKRRIHNIKNKEN